MRTFLIRRTLMMFPVAMAISVIVFALIHLVPGNPVDSLVGPGMPLEYRDALIAKYHLNESVVVQYLYWMGGLLSGDLGVSIIENRPVAEMLALNLWPSLRLGTAALVISFTLGIATGVFSACFKNTIWDHLTMAVALLGVTTPSFWLGLIFIFVFSVTLDWFPISGYGTFDALVLPAATLGLAGAGLVARITRASMLEVMPQDFVTLLHAKGIGGLAILFRHVLRNAIIPVITLFGLRLGWILGGAVTVEIVFSRPGLGRLLVTSLFRRDYAVVQGAMLLLAMAIILGTFIADVLSMLADPRLRDEKT